MCLRPRFIVNRRYVKICGGSPLDAVVRFGYAKDLYIPVDCGLCRECALKRGKMWRTRLLDHYMYHQKFKPDVKVQFCTMTIAPEHYHKFCDKDHSIHMIRLFLERYRKRYGRSFTHYITSEFGEKRGRLHFHMIGFGMLCDINEFRKLWSYGRVDMQTLKGPEGLTYVSGYVTKVVKGDKQSSEQVPLFFSESEKTFVLVSPGIGKEYCFDEDNFKYHYQNGRPNYVRVRDNGSPYALPRYYLNKIFSPIDLLRRREEFFSSLLKLPEPPFIVLGRRFESLDTYFDFLNRIDAVPLLSSAQFRKLSLSQKFKLWQTTK